MDPTKSGDAVRMTPGGQITSDMADPTNDDLPSTSSSKIKLILPRNAHSDNSQ